MINPHKIYALAANEFPIGKTKPQRSAKGGRFAFIALPFIIDKESSLAVRQQIYTAVADPDVTEIMLYIDSPGGSVAGTDDLATAVARAAKVKGVVCFVEDLCASAAYWIASQASEIICTPTSIVGSIGVFSVIEDSSLLEKSIGIKTYVVSTGALKGAGLGEVTEQQIDAEQRTVDSIGRLFLTAVRQGRDKSVLSSDSLIELFDGRVLVGEEARRAGLVDRIAVFEDVFAEIAGRNAPERFGELRGERALKKFDSLAGLSSTDSESAMDRKERAIADKYPQLAKRSLAQRKENDEKYKAYN